MEWYIRSCGVGPEHGYGWVRVDQGGQKRLEPAVLKTLKMYDLVEHEVFSVGLERSDEKLVLLVTGLKVEQSRDYQRRRVSNSMVCTGVSTDEPTLRAIAAHALRGGLDVLVDQAIQSDFDPKGVGFLVAPDLVAHLREQKAAGSAEPRVLDSRIGKNEEHLRRDLAEELDACQLPRRNGPLVVVTRNTDGGRMRLARVWRGVSRLVFVRSGEAGSEWHDSVEIALNFQGKDLSHIDWSGADLRYADLSETNLSYANLSKADLRHANLSKANLSHANLKGADLRSTNFWRAFYFATEFQGAVGNKATTWPFLMTPIGIVEREM